MERPIINDDADARAELSVPRTRPAWREGRHSLPFHELADDEFEVFSFVLLRKEHPADRIYYYGKTGDAGRDIIHEHGGRLRLIQCKRYGKKVGIGEIRVELAKLCVNVFRGRIPHAPQEVVFYVVPDVTADAADLIKHQPKWREEAAKALEAHLGEPPSQELLAFAHAWWPDPDYVTALSLTERTKKFDELREEFFAVRKVIDASLGDVQHVIQRELQPLKDLIAPLVPLTGPSGPNEAAETASPGGAPDPTRILEAFREASAPLLSWPTTLGEGRWIDRPELGQIAGRIDAEKCSTTLLIGPPGSGKSALLARLGRTCLDAGHVVIAIKADLLSVGIDTLATLSEQLHLPAGILECATRLAAAQTVVVLIDQLDALADLVDLRSGRLNALLQLIQRLSDQPNIHVVSSCRTFEHGHDVRLTSIEAEAVSLTLPSWETVAEVLQARQIDASRWPQEFRELLRTPQHLKVFLQRLQGHDEDRIFTTYQQLLDDLWSKCVTNPDGPDGRSRLLTDLAEQMAERETLWLPLVRYEDRAALVEALEADHILTRSENGFSIGFRHQTLFEHARARAFARGEGSLAGYVLARQDSLFVRPLLWSSLHYLRGADPAGYEAEMERLWGEPVRKHLRHLLIDFLGQVTAPPPSDRERLWLIDYLQQPAYRPKVLAAIRGNAAWFSILAPAHLAAVMRLPPRDAWPAAGVLGAAWAHDRAECFGLLEGNWLPDPAKDELTWRTLEQLPSWDEDGLEMACRIVRRTELRLSAVLYLASRIAERAPGLAVRLVAATLFAVLERLEAMPDPEPDLLPPDADETAAIVQQLTFRPRQRFERLLADHQGLSDLPTLAEEAPAAFLQEIWPWFVRVIEHITEPREPRVVAYRGDYSLATRLRNDEEDAHLYPVVWAMEVAVCGLARQDAPAFLAFVEREQLRDSMVVQRLLCRGFLAIVQTHPADGLRFLLGDPRRLVLGSFQDEYEDTCALITALVPHLGDDRAAALEAAITAWERYRPDTSDLPAPARFEASKGERQHRLRLLAAFAPERLSTPTRSLFHAEITAFPHHQRAGVHRCEGGRVVSPMSAQQMVLAKDRDILNLFTVLHDRQDSHPRHFLLGGSREAAHQFGLFAKEHPRRAVALLRQFTPGQQEAPVSHALVPLSEATFETQRLFALVSELDARGFRSEEVRASAARALGRRAAEGTGLPDSVCRLLERWLGEPWEHREPTVRESSEDQAERRARSVLWQGGGAMALPFGTYDLLRTLTYGYLLRKPPATDAWMAVLEAHVERADSSATWEALARDLRYLRLCDHERAARFLTRLFERFPGVRDGVHGAALLTHAWWFLPPGLTHRFLRELRDSDWTGGPQAYGELLALRWLVVLEDEEASREVEHVLDPRNDACEQVREVRLGIAFTAAHLWREAEHHERATDVLVRVLPLADEAVGHAVMHAFTAGDVLTVDARTNRLLRALLSHPSVLCVASEGHFVERLQDMLSTEPDLVCDLASELVRLRADDLTNIQTGFAANTSHLTNIALTLQRLGGPYRSRGLDLFEQLLDLGVHDAQSTLNELDKRPLNVVHLPRRTRSRMRRRRQSGTTKKAP
jgi:ATPase family associated with various cellular activities (AAA)/Restriction endonuclease